MESEKLRRMSIKIILSPSCLENTVNPEKPRTHIICKYKPSKQVSR